MEWNVTCVWFYIEFYRNKIVCKHACVQHTDEQQNGWNIERYDIGFDGDSDVAGDVEMKEWAAVDRRSVGNSKISK